MTRAAPRRPGWPRTLLLCGLGLLLAPGAGAAGAATDDPPPATFDEESLNRLLADIRALRDALARGIDDSSGALIERLPGLWYRLETLERQIQQRLPVLREELRKLERALRDAIPAEPRDPPPLIEV